MRPVRKGASPIQGNFNNYQDARPFLIARVGMYCSYCERRIPTNLAVEHLEPKKGQYGKPALAQRWSNFLLACVNCNSTKGDKQIRFDQLFFPDRDNTFCAFEYLPDGTIEPATGLSQHNKHIARNTLKLVGLDKSQQRSHDSNKKQVALDRVSQRISAWAKAEASKALLSVGGTPQLRSYIANTTATSVGYFSVWMTVFNNDHDMKLQLIQAFKGTEESGCFDMASSVPISPAPNPDNLSHGSKI